MPNQLQLLFEKKVRDGTTFESVKGLDEVRVYIQDPETELWRHITLTHEGIVVDIVDQKEGRTKASYSATYDEILSTAELSNEDE